MDTVSKADRSRIMARVRSSGNRSTERAVVSIFRKEGVTGWRRDYPLEGRPDFVFPRSRLALFIDGCLWHGCDRHCRIPKTNRGYWKKKIMGNIKRASVVKRQLSRGGWAVVRIWEHEIKTLRGSTRFKSLQEIISRQSYWLKSAKEGRGAGQKRYIRPV